jgi:hypothetical protein
MLYKHYFNSDLDVICKTIFNKTRVPTVWILRTVREEYKSIQLGIMLAARCRFVPVVSTAVVLLCSVHCDPGCDILHGSFSSDRFTRAQKTNLIFYILLKNISTNTVRNYRSSIEVTEFLSVVLYFRSDKQNCIRECIQKFPD